MPISVAAVIATMQVLRLVLYIQYEPRICRQLGLGAEGGENRKGGRNLVYRKASSYVILHSIDVFGDGEKIQ